MRILIDHLISDHLLAEIADSNVLYRPELASIDEHLLGSELARERPDALLTTGEIGGVAARRWRSARPQHHLVVVMIGTRGTASSEELPAGIISRTVTPGDDSFVKALSAAEDAWFDAAIKAKPLATRAHTWADNHRSVAMVGAGVVNLITALRLAREGYDDIIIYEKSPDPRIDAYWEEYGCSRGGGDARMFTLTEADGYYFGTAHGTPEPLRTSIRNGGWQIMDSSTLSGCNLAWASMNAAIPRWLGNVYTSDILSFNRAAGELWHNLMEEESALFDGIGLKKGILRLYTDERHWHKQIARQEKVGAEPLALTPEQIAERHPSLGDAVRRKVVAGAIEVLGFTVQVHAFLSRLITLLERLGVRFAWGQEVLQLRHDETGAPSGLCVVDETIRADHFILSTGAYGGNLLRGTASNGLIHGVLGAWLTLPGSEPALERSLKIVRNGHLAEDANVTIATGHSGETQLIIGSGYGWTGQDPNNIDAEQLSVLYDAVEDTARTFFPGPFAEALECGLLASSRRYCIRPWTASSLGLLEIVEKSDRGMMIITGGHNTGGFAQAPVVAEAVAAALRGQHHLMHTLYHPDRLRTFLGVRPRATVNIGGQSSL